MPRDSPRAGAAALGPLESLGLVPLQRVLHGIAAYDRKVLVLRAGVEPERKPEPVGERELVVDRIARVEWIALFARLAGEDCAVVG